jgi:hypothetical protein
VSDIPPLRIIITGSRTTTTTDNDFIVRTISRTTATARDAGRPVTVIDGDCPNGGADTACRQWINNTPGVDSEPHRAPWNTHGKAAGPIRNQSMIDSGAHLCIAFPRHNSRGTWDCIRRAADAGIPVRIYPLDTKPKATT